jgi:hypothetical protein
MADPWYWTAWQLSGENAAEAVRIYNEVDVNVLMLLVGIKTYGASFVPKFDK